MAMHTPVLGLKWSVEVKSEEVMCVYVQTERLIEKIR